jgi:adenylate cyclase
MTRRRKRLASDPQLGLLELLHMAGGGTLLLFGTGFWMMGLYGAALVEAAYVSFTIGTLLWLQVSPRAFRSVVWAHVVIVALVPMGVSITLGGPAQAGGFGVWGLIGPLAAMMFLGRRATWIAGGIFLGTLVVPALFTPAPVDRWITAPPEWVTHVLGVANIAGASILSLATLAWFVQRLRFEQERADALLLSVLPREIVRALRGLRHHRVGSGEGATILVAEIAELCPIAARLTPLEVRDLLHAVFSHFDGLAAGYKAERVRTIDDTFTVFFGLPEPYADHARDAAALALEMRSAVASQRYAGQRVELRIGINSGPVSPGVVGRRRFIYEIWGRALSVAARMESRAEPGCVLITRDSHELLQHEFLCRKTSLTTSRASGSVQIWDLLDRREEIERPAENY